MEKGDSLVRIAKRQTALGTWIQIIGAILTLHTAEDEELSLPVPAARYLLKSRDCLGQPEHNVFNFRDGRSPGSFVMVSRSEAIYLLICPAWHIHLQYPMSEKMKLAKLLHLEEVRIPVYPVFILHGCLQHGSWDWRALTALATALTSFLWATTWKAR